MTDGGNVTYFGPEARSMSSGVMAFGTVDERNVLHLLPRLSDGTRLDWGVLRRLNVNKGQGPEPMLNGTNETGGSATWGQNGTKASSDRDTVNPRGASYSASSVIQNGTQSTLANATVGTKKSSTDSLLNVKASEKRARISHDLALTTNGPPVFNVSTAPVFVQQADLDALREEALVATGSRIVIVATPRYCNQG